jgi:cell division protease FtsH
VAPAPSSPPTSSGARPLRILLGSLLALVVIFAALVWVAFRVSAPGTKITLDALYRRAAAGEVMSARLLDEDAVVVGQLCSGGVRTEADGRVCTGRVESFHAAYPTSGVATSQLIERIGARAPLEVDRQAPKAVAKLLLSFVLPLMILANLFGIIFVSRGSESSISEIAGFGRMGRKRQGDGATAGTGVSFADVAGQESAVAELREVIDYLKEPARFEAFGAIAPKGVLLFGPPGCGKTLLARAAAGESGVAFVSVSGTEFVESLVGVGAARVRDLFATVRQLAPAIVFIDEIDAVGRKREGEGVSGGEREQTLNQLLVELDGFEVASGVVIMGATNRPDILDPALLRPGRFDRQVTLDAPDVEGRRAILQVHAKGRNLAADVDLDLVARRTPGFTGADLANVMNEAVLLAIRSGTQDARITQTNLSEAISRVLHGPHRGKLMSAPERERIAVHESGHALVAAAVGRGAQVDRVSIVARARGLGQSVLSDGDRVLLTGDELEAELAVALGGVAAEELRFGRSSTAAEDDLERATTLAKEMVGLYGMAPSLGRARLLSRNGGYLGTTTGVDPSVSEQTLQALHEEIRRLLADAEAKASSVLSEHAAHLDAMAARLVEEETLEGAPLAELLAAVRVLGTNGSAAPRRRARAARTSAVEPG